MIQFNSNQVEELTREGTTGVPAGAAGLGGTGGASGTFLATTAASHSASLNPNFFIGPSFFSLALTVKTRFGHPIIEVFLPTLNLKSLLTAGFRPK